MKACVGVWTLRERERERESKAAATAAAVVSLYQHISREGGSLFMLYTHYIHEIHIYI